MTRNDQRTSIVTVAVLVAAGSRRARTPATRAIRTCFIRFSSGWPRRTAPGFEETGASTVPAHVGDRRAAAEDQDQRRQSPAAFLPGPAAGVLGHRPGFLRRARVP
jgi:hypothetical protein